MSAVPGIGAARAVRLPRPLHPGAWWLWALGLATAASRTTNPLLLVLLVGAAGVVVSARRGTGPWARSFRGYLVVGAIIVVVRLIFRMLLAGGIGDTVIGTLPSLSLPQWVTGLRLGGPVTLESLLAGLYDGMRLAAIVVCVGAANALADPKRMLRSLPGALYEVGVALVVAVNVAPQLAESVARIRRARRLRGAHDRRGVRALRPLVVPVMEDALERSLGLAAAMDARGYGRLAVVPTGLRRLTGVLVLGGLVALAIGAYGLLDGTGPGALGIPMLVLGVLAGGAGLALGGRRVTTSRYRPDPWRAPEWGVVATGVAPGITLIVAGILDPGSVLTSPMTGAWPTLPPLAAAGILLGALPAWMAPPVEVPR